jgi:DNA-binding transcriptional ArsR family regulator
MAVAAINCVDTQLQDRLTGRVDAVLVAIAHPARRRMIALARAGERTSSELAEAAGLTRPAASQHLRVLREAGLVSVRRQGGYRYYSTREDRLDALRAFLEDLWVDRLTALGREAERRHTSSGSGP